MSRTLLKKSLHESKWLFLSCAAALFAFCWLRVWIVSQFEMSRFRTIVEQFRELERFSPVPFEQLFTYTGRIALTYDEPIVIVCITVWAIARGSDCVSGELNRGTMEMLLAQPVSRFRVLVSKSLVTVAGVGLLSFITWLGIYAAVQTVSVKEVPPRSTFTVPYFDIQIPLPRTKREPIVTPMNEKVDVQVFAPAAVNLFALGFFLSGLTTFVSSADRYRWRTIGIVAGFFIIQLIMEIVGVASDRFRWLLRTSFFTAYDPEKFVSIAHNSPERSWALTLTDADGRYSGVGPLGFDLILIGMGLLAFLGAAVVFSRRDLPAPL